MAYKYRIIIYNVNADGYATNIRNDFFLGRLDKKYYMDYLKENDEKIADDMKFIALKYKEPNEKRWWKKKMLWNNRDYFKNLEEIKKNYNIIVKITHQIVILATPLNRLIV